MKKFPVQVFMVFFVLFILSCEKDEPQNETDTVTDSEGRTYKTVKIGNQWWMAENLNTGTMISSSFMASDNDTVEKYCYDNNAVNCEQFGGLYLWNELMNYMTQESIQGICPDGWHIPSDGEVKQLEMELGMTQAQADQNNTWRGNREGEQMKDGGSSGYNLKLGGAKKSNENFFNISSYGYVYTSSRSATGPWRRCIYSGSKLVGRYDTYPVTYAMSVRCVKD